MSDTDNTETHSSPMQFPCDFVIKVMGKTSDQFEDEILTLIQKHYQAVTSDNVSKRFSKDQRYTSLSISVHAQNKAELDAVYQDLTQCQSVLMAL
mgnify:CR=1 FL=1